MLTQDDIVSKKNFPDIPFISMAVHDRRIDRNDGYPVPYRCFSSKDVDNLFMAGRCISVTHEALGTVRAMKTCGMMGEVDGKAASLASRHDTTPRGVYEKHWADMDELLTLPGQARRKTPDAPPEVPAAAIESLPSERVRRHLVVCDAGLRVAGVVVLASYDNEPYVGDVRDDEAFRGIYRGMTFEDLVGIDSLATGVLTAFTRLRGTWFGRLAVPVAVLPVATRRNVYCPHLCAHGAVQQLLVRFVNPKRSCPDGCGRGSGPWPGPILTALLHLPLSLVDNEPFDGYLPTAAGVAAVAIFVVAAAMHWWPR